VNITNRNQIKFKVCPHIKTKPNTFQHSVIKPQLNAVIFGVAI